MKRKKYVDGISPEARQDVYYNERIKVVETPTGGYEIIQRMIADRPIFRDKRYVPIGDEKAERRPLYRISAEDLQSMSSEELDRLRKSVYPNRQTIEKKALSDAFHDMATNRVEIESGIDYEERNRQRSARRAKARCRDYIMSEYDFQYFVTMTTNGDDFDRHDIPEACRRLSVWLNNQVQRKGLKYLLVPELHKDGAVHWHGFINDALRTVHSGTYVPPQGGKPIKESTVRKKGLRIEDCKPVYNLPEWPYGFTTAIPLYGEKAAIAAYICKYITKQFDDGAGLIGGRYYLHSNNLRKPVEIYGNAGYDDAAGYEIETPGCRLKVDTEFCNTEEEKHETWCGATKEEWADLYESASTE